MITPKLVQLHQALREAQSVVKDLENEIAGREGYFEAIDKDLLEGNAKGRRGLAPFFTYDIPKLSEEISEAYRAVGYEVEVRGTAITIYVPSAD